MSDSWYTHELSPIAFTLFEIAFPWYWLAYAAGFIMVMLLGEGVVRSYPQKIKVKDYYDFFLFSWLGLLVGGRLGYVFFYNLDYYLEYPHQIYRLWNGGMSFHGAVVGAWLGGLATCRAKNIRSFFLWDVVLRFLPLALMLGRIANFINAELVGRKTNSGFGVIFPRVDDAPRHPSQLYEALGEGPFLFALLWLVWAKTETDGVVSACFLLFYGIIRFMIEFFREADPQLGYLSLGLTMGQWLCFLMIGVGTALLCLRTETTVRSPK